MSVPYSTLNNIKVMSNYGFYITGNTTDPVYTKGWMSNTPNISIQGNTVFIDYSHTYNTSDLSFLSKIFGSTGITFTLSTTEYYDDVKNKRTYIGGSAVSTQLLNGNRIIVGSILSGFTSNSDYNYYSKENFIDTPQITPSQIKSFTGYFLVNSMPEMSLISFDTMGILGNRLGYEEYIELSNGTGANQGRIQVDCACKLKDGQEVLYFTSGGEEQNLQTVKTVLRLYMRGDTDSLTSPKLSNLNGVFITRKTSDDTLVNCSENQSENQAILRKQYLSNNNIDSYGLFVNCNSCPEVIYGTDSTVRVEQIGDAFTTLIFLRIINGTTANPISSIFATFATQNTNLILPPTNANSIIKIDLSHPTLLKYDLNIFTEPTRTVLIPTSNFIKYGEVGYNNSYAILKNYIPNSTLYCTLQGTSTINFTIQV